MRTGTFRRPFWVIGTLLIIGAGAFASVYVARHWQEPLRPAVLDEETSPLYLAPAAAPQVSQNQGVIGRTLGENIIRPAAKPVAEGSEGLEVIATFVDSDPKRSMAIMTDRNKRPALVGTGDRIDTSRVASIRLDGVLVRLGDNEAFIKLTPWDTTGGSSAASSSETGPAAPTAANPPRTPPARTPRFDSRMRGMPRVTDMFSISLDQKRYYQSHLNPIISDAKLSAMTNPRGEVIGLKINNAPSGSLAADRGFKEGDVIKFVYNTQVRDAQALYSIAARILKDQPSRLDIVIERDGEDMTLTYSLPQDR